LGSAKGDRLLVKKGKKEFSSGQTQSFLLTSTVFKHTFKYFNDSPTVLALENRFFLQHARHFFKTLD